MDTRSVIYRLPRLAFLEVDAWEITLDRNIDSLTSLTLLGSCDVKGLGNFAQLSELTVRMRDGGKFDLRLVKNLIWYVPVVALEGFGVAIRLTVFIASGSSFSKYLDFVTPKLRFHL